MKRRAWLRATAYGLFSLASLGLGGVMTFPAKDAGMRLAYELEKATHGTWTLSFGEATTWRISGLRLKNVKLRHLSANAEPLVLPVHALGLRLQLLPLLVARLSCVVDMLASDGHLVAVVSPGRNQNASFALDLHNWDIGQPPWLQAVSPLPVAGKLNGQGELAWEAETRKSVGRMSLRSTAVHLGPGSIGGIGLPIVDLGELNFIAELKDGRFRLQEFKQQGGNLSLQGKFGVQLKGPLAQSVWETCAMVRLDPTFLSANPKVRSAIQIAEMQLKRDAEGYLHVPLAGTLAAPKLSGGLCR